MSTNLKKDIKVYNKHVAFWGSPFSNFYPCSFEKDGVQWCTSEQYFMAQKAKAFKDDEVYERILKSTNPKEQKDLGRQVRNFDAEEWAKISFDAMHEGVYAKFSQNEELKNLLLDKDFEEKGFVEGSPFDDIWGVKIDWRNEEVDDETKWKGKNLLGKVLNKVREELK